MAWPCGLLTTSDDGVIMDVNDTFLSWTGFAWADLVGVRRLRDLLTVGGRIFFETHIGPLLVMQGGVSEIAVDIVGANGKSFPVLLNAAVRGKTAITCGAAVGPGETIDGQCTGQVRYALAPATQRRSYERELLEARRAADEAGAASERVQRRLSLMADVNLVLSGTLSLSTALDRLATVLAADQHGFCLILTVDGEDEMPVAVAAAAHHDPELLARARALGIAVAASPALSVIGDALGRPAPLLLPGLTLAVDGKDAPTKPFGPFAVIPVRARDQHVATLVLTRDVTEPAYTSEDLLELATLAEPIGLFVDNLRLYAREHNRAVVLQEALLTPAVAVPDLEIVTRYLPGADGAMVGGDWYDSLVRANGSTVLAIGDVTGHDSNAAAAMGQLRGLLRAIAYSDDAPPAEILAKTDRAARGLGVGCLATAVVVEFRAGNPPDFVWANAGHPPPALITAGGQVLLLEDKPDLLLGVEPSTSRRNHQHAWQPGDTLLLYTDGVIENQFRSIDTGLQMLVESLQSLAREPLQVLCEQLIARMSGGHGSDDIAVLAVRASGCHDAG